MQKMFGVWVGLLAVVAGGLAALLEKTDGKFAARQVLFFAAAKTYLRLIMYEGMSRYCV